MAALLGPDFDQAAAAAAEAAQGAVCQAANDNGGGQVVISGTRPRSSGPGDRQGAGAKRAVLLAVSAPFHCALMQPAAEAMAEALAEVTDSSPLVPPWSPMSTAAPLTDPDAIRRALVAQVTGTVRWRESVASWRGRASPASSRSAPARC